MYNPQSNFRVRTRRSIPPSGSPSVNQGNLENFSARGSLDPFVDQVENTGQSWNFSSLALDMI